MSPLANNTLLESTYIGSEDDILHVQNWDKNKTGLSHTQVRTTDSCYLISEQFEGMLSFSEILYVALVCEHHRSCTHFEALRSLHYWSVGMSQAVHCSPPGFFLVSEDIHVHTEGVNKA